MADDLHARTLAELDRLDPHRLTTLGKVVSAVVQLHAPNERRADDGYLLERWCKGCDVGDLIVTDNPSWPCSTIQAIADQLGLTEGDQRG